MGGVCQSPPPGWPGAAAPTGPGPSSVLRLLRFLKCHLGLMAALISCIGEKCTPVVSGYICSQGSVPTHAHCVGVIRHRRVPWQSAVRTTQKRKKKKSGKTPNYEIGEWTNYLDLDVFAPLAASRRVLYRRKQI